MGGNTPIEWAHHTFNCWWGCVEAQRFADGGAITAPECMHCYARTLAKRWGFGIWGKDAPRRFFGGKHWDEPLKWDRLAAAAGERHRVFCSSMADVFEDRDELNPHRARLWELIEATPSLDWLLLTKRPENMRRMAPARWGEAWPRNVWAGTTVGHPDSLWRAAHLMQVPASIRFLSMEPLTGPVDLGVEYLKLACGGEYPFPMLTDEYRTRIIDLVDWVIVGGESGAGSRTRGMRPEWARAVRDQCVAAGVPFFFKQWGERAPRPVSPDAMVLGDEEATERLRREGFSMQLVGKKAAGRQLDGREWNEIPQVRP